MLGCGVGEGQTRKRGDVRLSLLPPLEWRTSLQPCTRTLTCELLMGGDDWIPSRRVVGRGLGAVVDPGPGVTWPVYSSQNHRHPWAAGACGCGDELKASECGVCGV